MRFDKESVLESFKESLETTGDTLVTNWEETVQVEFKLSLRTVGSGIDKDYLPTIAGYANNLGGVIVFGIHPTSKEIIGIKDKYENLDNKYVSETVRNVLDGDFSFEFFTTRHIGKTVGFLVVKESRVKPVICKVSAGEARLGEIYYRYPALTSRIGAGELRGIITDEITKKTQKIIETFQKVVDAGNENIAILNTKTGEIESTEDNLKLTLSENILNKLNLIREGEIVNTEGAPAYVIKGEIEVESTTYVEKFTPTPFVFSEKDMFKYFLTEDGSHPQSVIEYIMTLQSFYSPIYFFLREAKLNVKDGIEFIDKINNPSLIESTRKETRSRIIKGSSISPIGKLFDNLSDIIDVNIPLDTTIEIVKSVNLSKRKNEDQQILRKLYFNSLINFVSLPTEIYKQNVQRAIEAFSNLHKSHVINNKDFFKAELIKINEIQMNALSLSTFRKVISKMDSFWHKDEVS